MTTHRENDLASVDTSFSVRIQHPRFLECVGAPESTRLLGHPPAEWLRVMDRRDALIAAVQLERDAGLMASNLDGAQRVCGRIAPHVLGGDAVCVRPGILSVASSGPGQIQ